MGLDMYLYNDDEQVGYWRKANQIHSWFVENVQNGEDDCREYDVPREKLVELLGIVEAILDGKEEPRDVLPTRSGFFFGSTDYGEWYMEDMKDTQRILSKLLDDEVLKQHWNVKYNASW